MQGHVDLERLVICFLFTVVRSQIMDFVSPTCSPNLDKITPPIVPHYQPYCSPLALLHCQYP